MNHNPYKVAQKPLFFIQRDTGITISELWTAFTGILQLNIIPAYERATNSSI